MMTGLMQDQNLEKQIEKQIGCMSGFLHIFDRQQILAGKRIYSTKRLPPSTGFTASPEPVKSIQSTAIREIKKPEPAEAVVSVPESPDRFKPSPKASYETATPPKSPLPLPMFDLKEGSVKTSWKFCKEMPRLSLDSRATVDSKGSLCPKEIRRDNSTNTNDEGYDKQRRSPSVIARLMGLEQLPSSDPSSSPETVKKPELRRSASESRVSRDLFHSRFNDCNNFQPYQVNKQLPETNLASNNCVRDNVGNVTSRNVQNSRVMESMAYSSRNQKTESHRTSQWRSPQQRRSFFDSADFFPEPKQTAVPMYGISDKNLKLRGIDEQFNDLETLKHILEALQLKGLLHSKRPPNRDSQRNFVYDPSFGSDDSQIVLMKPWRSPASGRRIGNDSAGTNRYAGEILPSVSPRKERGVLDRSGRSPVRARNSSTLNNSRNSNTIVKRKPLSIETQRSFHESSESRRSSPINSPKLTPKRSGSDYQSVTNRSPRSRKPAGMVSSKEKIARNFVTEDESSSFSESTGSTTSQSDPERSKMEEYREGKSLLERCDKLLHSIAEMNIISESQPSSASVLPSPVSVLDPAFDKDESSSPSPVMKRSIDFKDLTVDLEDDIWSSIISPATSSKDEEFISDDSDFTYISEILRASKYLPDDSSVFFFLEKQHYYNGNDTSKASKLQRELVFDIVAEILDRNRQLPPWNASSNSLHQICSEYQKIRERDPADNLLDLICGVLKKDLAGNNGWGDHPVETSEAILYIERLIFKDLVSETIRDLADFAAGSTLFAPRRKLVF
ncbi:hypothetical protein L1887_05935 [Cichorium endivia]|nr:hypothetical protein L1887_05935 [Cichorium endivia]